MKSDEEDILDLQILTTTTETPPPKLQLFSTPRPDHHVPWAPATPPHHTTASVPFRWEARPGKPKPCTTLTTVPTKSLELPPRLVESKMAKTPSPTSALEGPYYYPVGRSILESSSFRFLRKKERRHGGSFDGAISFGDGSPYGDPLGFTSSERYNFRKESTKGLFRNWRKIGTISFRGSGGSSTNSEVGEGSFVFSSFDDEGNGNRMRRKRSLLSFSSAKSRLWASIYGAVKQIIPRKTTKDDDL